MKVLVTGATGVYGRSVVERLVRAGHEVVAVARRPPKALPPGVRFAAADVQDRDALTAAMAGCEVVCHLAFVVTPIKDRELSRQISVGGTANVCEAMKRTGARRLVFASSAMSYGANPDNPPLFIEAHEQRPAADYVYGTDKKAAEQIILDSGVEAVLARTGVTVGRNIDNLLLDVFAAPAIIGIKGVDIRYQLVHQDDIGRFFATACESGPPGPVNVAPADFLPLRTIAQILGKRYVETSAKRALKAIEFAWRHDLADITPGEAAGISYLPRMDTTRLREEWGFECAWSTADGVVDLRRAVTGITAVAKRRVEVPWRLRFPTQRPGDVVSDAAAGRPGLGAAGGQLDSDIPLKYPTVRAFAGPAPLPALTLTTHLYVLRAAATGMLDTFGGAPGVRHELGGAGAAAVGHRLYVNDDVAYAVEHSGGRRRVVGQAYGREVERVAGWAAETLERATDPTGLSDVRLDAMLGLVLDDLAWFWAIAATGAALEGDELGDLAALLTAFPDGSSPFTATAESGRDDGGHSRARLRAERVVRALTQALARLIRERADRLVMAGAIKDADDVAHLTWDELLAPPHDLAVVIGARRAEHQRLAALTLPATVSVTGPTSAVATGGTR
ncbi:NAD-dependent epimerase/dehydratase family protein [Sporichthya sp.]|uniref:NAD-dependent epimerase/dehydratase family protein n=1 Tax=Sporichthya sp. TaxID=65475 RepID=UPI0017EC2D0E|nr:NAD-dependent epimerase/dehydratase family protein [Sporichthya sp.]MBA3742922.1 NAD-dependent epimerase/dehydratase family protein [Sporichthya sp.]